MTKSFLLLFFKKEVLASCLTFFCAITAQARPLYTLTATIPLGGAIKWDYLHFDSPTARLYISHGNEVTVVDTRHEKIIGALKNLPGSHGITVDPATGLIYADSAANSTLVAFNPQTLQPVATAPVLPDADGVTYDPFSKQIFVSGGDGDGFTPVSTATKKSAPTIALGSSPEFHVADANGSLYVDLVDANQISRINTTTNTITANWPVAPCQHPKGLAIDPATKTLFASCANATAVLLNAGTGKILTSFPIGKGTDAARFDPSHHRFLSSNGDGTLTIIAEPAPKKFVLISTQKTKPGARTMDVDPKTGRIFLVTARILKTVPPSNPSDHPHYIFAPNSLELLVYDPTN